MNFLVYVTPRVPMGFIKNVSPFGPAVRPAVVDIYISYIYMSEELYYIDNK